jgi:hypothetical protein
MNLLVDLKIFEDQKLNASSNSSLKNISWQGFNIQEQFTREAVIKAKSIKTLFSELNANFTLNSNPVPNPISAPIPSQETIPITTEDDRQSITIPRRIIPKSLILSVNRVLAFSDSDFEIKVEENKTVITWINSFAVDGEQEIEIGDTINVFYNYTEFISAEELNSDLYFEKPTEDDYRLLYLEASGRCKVVVNNIVEGDIYPVIVNGVKNPAYFLKSTKVEDIKIINENDEDVQVFVMIAR